MDRLNPPFLKQTSNMTPPKACILREYTKSPWKNGLGETECLAVHPKDNEEFTWKLTKSEARGDCMLAMRPGYDIALIQLPEAITDDTPPDTPQGPSAVLQHNDQETFVPIQPLVPYTYHGEWPTTCRVRSCKPIEYLSLFVNRKLADVSVTVDTVCALEDTLEEPIQYDSKMADLNQSEKQDNIASCMTRMLVAHVTLIYVVKGAISVSMETKEHHIVKQGEIWMLERHLEAEPTGLSMTPVASMHDLHALKETESSLSEWKGVKAGLSAIGSCLGRDLMCLEDATVMMVQVNMKSQRAASFVDLPGIPHVNRPSRAGSIIVYDDQPHWNLPESRNASSMDLCANMNATANLSVKYWESAKIYKPPVFSARFKNESDVPPPIVRDSLVIEEFPVGKISTAWINMMKQGLSEWIRIPVIVARGVEEGPVVGITAVIHGNELNGVPCIHRVITDIDVNRLKGTVVAVPCVNVPGYLRFSREFSDGKDLNRLFPGQEHGTCSQVFAYHVLTKIVEKFTVLIDLHTASFGRVNSYYVRCDMNDPGSAILARLQQPQIILHNSGQDGTLRSAAMAKGIKAITVEIGNPQLFQNQYVQWSYMGVMSILSYLGMFSIEDHHFGPLPPIPMHSFDGQEDGAGRHFPFLSHGAPSTIICSRGFWIYTQTGGVLEVYPAVNTIVKKGTLIARIKNIFGNIVDEIFSPASGITIGRSSNPVAMAGDRILHLGVLKKEGEALPKVAKENY